MPVKQQRNLLVNYNLKLNPNRVLNPVRVKFKEKPLNEKRH